MADDARIGSLIGGKYQLTKLLGRGAFGAVYEGMNTELEKRVAVKLIEPEYVQHDEVVGRFRNEAKAASRVESEHIVQVFDVGTDENHGLYMVMELLQGEDLAQRLDRELKLNPTLAVHIAVQACRGLAKAHAAGVVHRDLKPANIFLVTREDGSLMVKLVDFGISKMLFEEKKEEEGRALTRAGTTVGTPNYMSPEQTRGGVIDGRTDVWALGALLFEMLAGVPAYAHDATYEQTVIAIATEPEPDLAAVAPWVPQELVAVVSKALTRDLDKRIPDCTTFAKLLSEAVPDAARPRREESLYMEPSDFSAEPAPVARAATKQEAEIVDSLEPIAARRAGTTVSTRAVSTPPAGAKKSRWALFGAIGIGVVALAVVFGRDLLRRKPEPVEPAASSSAAPSVSTDPSASASAVAPKPTPKIAHPKSAKPKASVTAPKPTSSHP